MLRSQMLARLREIINESSTQHAWEETTLLAYLAEGQDKFCEKTGFFIDITNYTITLQTGIAVYAIPDRIIEIYDIFSGTKKLGKFMEQDRPVGPSDWDFTTDPEQTGAPDAWQADRATGFITFDNTPTAEEDGTVLVLRAWRYSLFELDNDDTDGEQTPAEPEVPTRFQWALIAWAAYRAYRQHDEEQQDVEKADDHLAEFNQYVVDGKLFMRRHHSIAPKVSTNAAYRV